MGHICFNFAGVGVLVAAGRCNALRAGMQYHRALLHQWVRAPAVTPYTRRALDTFVQRQTQGVGLGVTRFACRVQRVTMSSSSGLEQQLRELVASQPVVVFSKSWCGFCAQVKSLMQELQAPARIIELDELGNDGLELQNLLYAWTGQRTVPNVFIGGKHIGGCSETMEAYERGELVTLIKEAKRKSEVQ
jgi:glutaredoxin